MAFLQRQIGNELICFGALNWTVQWYRPGGGLTLDQIAERAIDFFVCDKTGKPK